MELLCLLLRALKKVKWNSLILMFWDSCKKAHWSVLPSQECWPHFSDENKIEEYKDWITNSQQAKWKLPISL